MQAGHGQTEDTEIKFVMIKVLNVVFFFEAAAPYIDCIDIGRV